MALFGVYKTFDVYKTSVADWASSIEISTELASEGGWTETLEVEENFKVLILTASISEDVYLPWPKDLKIKLTDPYGNDFDKDIDDWHNFIQLKNNQPSLVVHNDPKPVFIL